MGERAERSIERRSRLVTGWGRTAASRADVLAPATTAEVVECLKASQEPVIARGLGRSYNDAAQAAGGTVFDLARLQAPFQLSDETGHTTAGAGTSIDQLLRRTVPRGWFVPVTPGTRQVTLGGALAGDVHGKNHHVAGSFADHVLEAELLTPDGELCRISPSRSADAHKHPDLFWATAGGMGLTGIITGVSLQLLRVTSSRMLVDTDRVQNLDEMLSILAEEDPVNPYSVAWIDLVARGARMGRGVVTRGRHAERDDLPVGDRGDALAFAPRRPITAPPVFPPGVLNRQTVRAFNEAWFRRAPVQRRGEIQSIPAFFHPLDGVSGWNRVYGPRGFLQYQLVVPRGQERSITDAVRLISAAGIASFLAVLKRFGPGNPGWLSFPIEGWTLALDLPNVAGLAQLLDTLDELVIAANGRVNLTKDARVTPEALHAMYSRLGEFRSLRHQLDPTGRFRSDLARRLEL